MYTTFKMSEKQETVIFLEGPDPRVLQFVSLVSSATFAVIPRYTRTVILATPQSHSRWSRKGVAVGSATTGDFFKASATSEGWPF